MSCLLIQCCFVPKPVSPAVCFLCLLGFMLCMQRMRHRGEVKRGAGMEFCSIYHPEIFLLERHTLFSLSLPHPPSLPRSWRRFLLCLSPPSHFSSLLDMRSSHFIPGWLSSALKHCYCPPIPSCSIAAGIELHWPVEICSCCLYVFFPPSPMAACMQAESSAPSSITSLFRPSSCVPCSGLTHALTPIRTQC